MNNFICPHCGKSHYIINYSTSTAVYYPPVYKDGKSINQDGNVYKDYCSCLECKHDFVVERCNDTVTYKDEGIKNKPEVKTNKFLTDLQPKEWMWVTPSVWTEPTSITIKPYESEFKEILEAIKALKKQIDEVQSDVNSLKWKYCYVPDWSTITVSDPRIYNDNITVSGNASTKV